MNASFVPLFQKMDATFAIENSTITVKVDMRSGMSCGVPIRNNPEYQKTTCVTTNTNVPIRSVSSASCCSDDSVSAFYLSPATILPVQIGSWTGSISAGSSVNCNNIHVCPHGAGTHTECMGHIVADGPSILEMAPQQLLPGVVLTVCPQKLTKELIEAGDASASSIVGDFAVTAAGIHAQVRNLVDLLGKMGLTVDPIPEETPLVAPTSTIVSAHKCTCGSCAYIQQYLSRFSPRTLSLLRAVGRCVALRTLTPQAYLLAECMREETNRNTSGTGDSAETTGNQENFLDKAFRLLHATPSTDTTVSDGGKMSSTSISELHGHVHYSGSNPPYLTVAASLYLRHIFWNHKDQHILLDLPSADREDDGGRVQAHWAFFHQQLCVADNNDECDADKSDKDAAAGDNGEDVACDAIKAMDKCSVVNKHQMPTSHWKKKDYCFGWVENFPKQKSEYEGLFGRRSITELCWFPESGKHTSGIPAVGMWDIRVMAVESDAGPSMPIFYEGVLSSLKE